MDLEAFVDKVCRIPTSGDQRSRILEAYEKRGSSVSAEAIEANLRLHPDLVDEWLQYSADQRCSPAWYVIHSDRDNAFEVGMPGRTPIFEFNDGFFATAFFIKCHLDRSYSPGCFLFFMAPKPKPAQELLAYVSAGRGKIRSSE